MLLKKMLVAGIKLESKAVFVRLISAAKENQPLIFFLLPSDQFLNCTQYRRAVFWGIVSATLKRNEMLP